MRDLAGLIVIDFIDMDEKRNNRSVERKLSDCLRQDRARIQVGRISHFGLLEMSRQRIRASVLESSTEPCPQCGGSGHVRSVSSVALQLLRGLEEILMKGATHNLVVRTRTDVALYVLNHKRGHLRDLENSFKVTLAVIADPTVSGQQSFIIDRGEQVHTLEAAKALLAAQVAAFPPQIEEAFDDDEPFDIEIESEVETDETEGLADDLPVSEGSGGETDADGHKRKRRRRRRGRSGEPREGGPARDDNDVPRVASNPDIVPGAVADEGESDEDESEEQPGVARADQAARRRAAAPPSRTSRRTPPARRTGGRSGRIDRRRTRTDIGSGSDQRGCRFRRVFACSSSHRCRWCNPNPSRRRPSSHSPIASSRSRPVHPHPSAESARDRSGGRTGRAAAFDRARKGQLPGRCPARGGSCRPAQPARADGGPCPGRACSRAVPEATTETQPRRAGWWSRRFGNGE